MLVYQRVYQCKGDSENNPLDSWMIKVVIVWVAKTKDQRFESFFEVITIQLLGYTHHTHTFDPCPYISIYARCNHGSTQKQTPIAKV